MTTCQAWRRGEVSLRERHLKALAPRGLLCKPRGLTAGGGGGYSIPTLQPVQAWRLLTMEVGGQGAGIRLVVIAWDPGLPHHASPISCARKCWCRFWPPVGVRGGVSEAGCHRSAGLRAGPGHWPTRWHLLASESSLLDLRSAQLRPFQSHSCQNAGIREAAAFSHGVSGVNKDSDITQVEFVGLLPVF